MENKDNQIQIETRIKSEIICVQKSIAELKLYTQPIEPDCAIGRISRMDAINNKSINEAALLKAEHKLKALNIALLNINDPDFGKCARCHQEIPIGRILLVPQSRFCVNYAS